MSDSPSNSVLLEKISNLGSSLHILRKENVRDHTEIIGRQDKTNGRVKKCELFYAGLVGATSVIALVWTVATFFIK